MADAKVMEVKKRQSPVATTPSAAEKAKGITHYLSEVKAEFAKITWTSREELQTYTKVVVGATFLFGLSVYAVDLAIQTLLSLVESTMRFLVG